MAAEVGDQDAAGPVLTVRPANEVTWDELAAVFGSRGPASRLSFRKSNRARLKALL